MADFAEGQLYCAEKFAPSRCPACRNLFDRPEKLKPWMVVPPVEAAADRASLFPEIYGSPSKGNGHGHSDTNALQQLDFVQCTFCGNATLRLMLDQRTCASLGEAEALVIRHDYCLVRVTVTTPGMAARVVALAQAAEAKRFAWYRRLKRESPA